MKYRVDASATGGFSNVFHAANDEEARQRAFQMADERFKGWGQLSVGVEKLEGGEWIDDDIDRFINNCTLFDSDSFEPAKKVYESYMAYYEFDEASVKRGEAMGIMRFSRMILKKYDGKIAERVRNIGDEGNLPTRCFVGLKLKPIGEKGGN